MTDEELIERLRTKRFLSMRNQRELQDDAAARIDALIEERDRLRGLVDKARAELEHAAIFVRTREKMHSDGVVLYDELLAALVEKI